MSGHVCNACGAIDLGHTDAGYVVLTAEQVAQVLGLLDVICRDSLEAPFADVVAFERADRSGESREISGAFREIADLMEPKP